MKNIFFIAIMILTFAAHAAVYNPLQVSSQHKIKTVDLTINDQQRKRDIPIRVYLPSTKTAAPLILFSHGLGGSRKTCAYLGKHWAARGYVAVFIQHPGSDESVWKSQPRNKRMAAMKKAANLSNFMLRVKDIPALLDQLERWQLTDRHILKGRLNLKQIGMSGHSFGAITTQAVSGQHTYRGTSALTDSRIKAALAFSPSSPRRGTPKQAFGKVKIPWMLMTGTKDIAFIGNTDVKSRLAVFKALPPGEKYEVVLYNAEHSTFTQRALPSDSESRNPNHHQAIKALSTAFWDSYLRGDTAAKTWLDSDGPRSVLEKNDRWNTK
jgi:predicted dienelactone hydrolase